jgi:hypothetical protein
MCNAQTVHVYLYLYLYSISSSPPSPLRVSIRQADLLQSALETLKSQASEAQVPAAKKGRFSYKDRASMTGWFIV